VPSFDAEAVDCRVSVFPEGKLKSFGHDVDLRVTDLTLTIGDDDSITGEFAVDSLRVVSDGPSEKDRKDIQGNAEKTLEAQKYPTIKFSSTSVERDGDRAKIDGDLKLHGVTNPISVEARKDGDRWTAEVTLDQRKYNIKPFSAMMGALKIKPEVTVHISVPDS
jgi:polyisoprenoid-binding protein YceI